MGFGFPRARRVARAVMVSQFAGTHDHQSRQRHAHGRSGRSGGGTIDMPPLLDLDEVLRERNKINTLLRESIPSSTAAALKDGFDANAFDI